MEQKENTKDQGEGVAMSKQTDNPKTPSFFSKGVGLKQLKRRRRIIELRCSGLTIPQICEKLREEGLRTSQRTVWADLHSSTVQEFVEELTRKQLADITLLGDDYETRLKYRNELLKILLPSHVENKIEGTVQMETVKIGFEADPDLKRALMEEADRQREAKRLEDEKRNASGGGEQ